MRMDFIMIIPPIDHTEPLLREATGHYSRDQALIGRRHPDDMLHR